MPEGADFIRWQDVASVGDPALDGDHRGILALINRLYRDIQRPRGAQNLRAVSDAIEDYTHRHFRAEEARLEACGYDALETHRTLHREMIQWTGSLRGTLHASDEAELQDILNYLKRWWTGHILHADRRYAPWLGVRER